MSVDAVFLLESPSQSRTARDLWAELNRVRCAAWTAADKFDGVARALKSPDQHALEEARRAVDDVLSESRLDDLSHQLSSMESANDDCDQAHDPELWDIRSALLESQVKIARYRQLFVPDVALLGAAEKAAEQLRLVADLALDVTAAAEAEAALKGRSVGAAVRLADVFPQLKGRPDQQKKLAHRLAIRAGRLVVDEQRAVLYVKSRSLAVQAATCAAPLLWTLLGAIVLLLPFWIELGVTSNGEFWHTWQTPLGAYALVLAGVMAHILVAAQKERQVNAGAPLPIGSPVDWLHTRWASIGLTFVWAVVVVFGLALGEYGRPRNGAAVPLRRLQRRQRRRTLPRALRRLGQEGHPDAAGADSGQQRNAHKLTSTSTAVETTDR
jgi:hypothetical protein